MENLLCRCATSQRLPPKTAARTVSEQLSLPLMMTLKVEEGASDCSRLLTRDQVHVAAESHRPHMAQIVAPVPDGDRLDHGFRSRGFILI